MTLPLKVQIAADTFARYELPNTFISPLFYRAFLRIWPHTPPPLFGASKLYWRLYWFSFTLFVGVVCALFFALFGISDRWAALERPAWLASLIVFWGVWGFVGWHGAREARCGCAREAASLGLPTWEAFSGDWSPAREWIHRRADPDRYWLLALWNNPTATLGEMIGIGTFIVIAAALPAKASSIAEVAAVVYFVLTVNYATRTSRGIPLSEEATAYRAIGGFWMGFIFAGAVWANTIAEARGYPGSWLTAVYAAIVLLLHSIEWLTFEKQKKIKAQVERADQEKQLFDARLASLKAQITPHFIFNTLAHLRSMIASDPKNAERMADTLSDFLRASISALKHDWSTVAAEMELARAYLDLAKLRMGSRLSGTVRVDAAAAELPLPPLLLQTLLENAIQHGIEPKAGTGNVLVTADVVGDRVS